MGHAGAIISGSSGTAQAKKDALEAVGIKVGTTPTEVADRSGSLRIARVKGVETVYFLHHGSWATLAGGHSSSHRAIPVLGMITSDAPDRPFGHQEARVAFDNFVVTGANPNCPA